MKNTKLQGDLRVSTTELAKLRISVSVLDTTHRPALSSLNKHPSRNTHTHTPTHRHTGMDTFPSCLHCEPTQAVIFLFIRMFPKIIMKSIELQEWSKKQKKKAFKSPDGEVVVMLKILQTRLQQYVNQELPDVQAGFRKGRGSNLPTSTGSLKKQESSRRKKKSISYLLTMPKPLTVWITLNCGKFWKRWEYQTTWPASWETCMQVRKQQLELDMKQQTASK